MRLPVSLLVAAFCVSACASDVATTRLAPTSAPCVERIDLSAGFILISTPIGYEHGDQPPLIVCLHETDTGAAAIIEFWRRLRSPIGAIFVAPQHHMPGWREQDLPCITAMCRHLRKHVTYDRRRVLLTGYSAGGAMAFHLLYAERFPATALAAMANYVPPSITPEMAAARRDLPVFYAVGTRDINQDRMTASISLLQTNCTDVTLLRPDIGHRLDRTIGQRAMDWFIQTTTRQSMQRVKRAKELAQKGSYAAGLACVEPIVSQRRWHLPEVVAAAEPILGDLERPGLQMLAEAERLVRRGERATAAEQLRNMEAAYGDSRLGKDARRRRADLEADPDVRSAQDALQEEKMKRATHDSLLWAQKLVAKREYQLARKQCRTIIQMYPDSDAAARARTLLGQLDRAGK